MKNTTLNTILAAALTVATSFSAQANTETALEQTRKDVQASLTVQLTSLVQSINSDTFAQEAAQTELAAKAKGHYSILIADKKAEQVERLKQNKPSLSPWLDVA